MVPAPLTLEPDDFFYYTVGSTEDDTGYVPGGFHPTIIGDVLGGSPQRQYRIMHKLGWGSYSTVWLAQKTDEPNVFVSVKITTASDDTQTQEVQMLQKAQPNDQSQSHVLKLLDHFTLHGPNGTHTVIVTEVVVPLLSLLPKQSLAWRKAIAYGLSQAMAQVHAKQIVHGDWHLGNVGIAMPQLAESQDYRDVMSDLDSHDLTVVLTYDPAKQTASLPAYLISPCNITAYYLKTNGTNPPQVKVLDFGSAHLFGTHPHALQCAREACAPEIVFAHVFEKIDNPSLDPPADVWALGTAIYEIVTGSPLFRGVSLAGLSSAMPELGRIPPRWEKWSASLSDKKVPDADEWWGSRWKEVRRECENDEDADALIRLLKRVLVLDPTERPTSAQIVDDPWFQIVSPVNVTAPSEFISNS